jgi:putative phosphoribosyl transferase
MGSMKSGPYRNRKEAGQVLAAHVRERFGALENAVVLALPRGGVPVGFEVARVLHRPLDVFVVRKLGVPEHEEVAMGAIAGNGFELLNEHLVAELGLTPSQVAAVAAREKEELHRRERVYRADRPAIDVGGRTVIVVDDGLATGFSMRAAIGALRPREANRLIVAVPVGAPETCAEIEREVDGFVCPLQPEPFHAVGLWYRDFAPTTDDEVRHYLATPTANHGASLPSRSRN